MDCPTGGIDRNEMFPLNGASSILTPTLGATVQMEQYSILVVNRTSLYHGVQLDLSHYVDCMLPGEDYVISFQVRLHREGMENVLTDCASVGKNCLKIFTDFLPRGASSIQTTTKYEIPPSVFHYGDWMYIDEYVSFENTELNSTNAFLSLRIGGCEIGADLEIGNFSLTLAPDAACHPAQVDCSDLVQCNGDAQYGVYPSPFKAKGGANILVEAENGNQFWRIERDESISDSSGLSWKVPVDCVVENAVYKFSMRFRLHLETPGMTVAVHMQSYRTTSSSSDEVVVACPADPNAWTICEGYFTIPKFALGNLQTATVYIVTEGTSTSTYDVDNISFRYVYMEGPITSLVVPAIGILGKWGVGASLLITSHTIGWSDQYVRTITSVSEYDVTGLVVLALSDAIPRPSTTKTSVYPVEVALLSRNIVFDGGSGLTVFRTPNLVQRVVGVKFKDFRGTGSSQPLRKYRSYRHAPAPADSHSIISSKSANPFIFLVAISRIIYFQKCDCVVHEGLHRLGRHQRCCC
jgi:hypothetical protein